MASDLGRRARELVQELKSYDSRSLSPYNVSACTKPLFPAHSGFGAQISSVISTRPPSCGPAQEEMVRLVFSEVDEHNAQTEAIVRWAASQKPAGTGGRVTCTACVRACVHGPTAHLPPHNYALTPCDDASTTA